MSDLGIQPVIDCSVGVKCMTQLLAQVDERRRSIRVVHFSAWLTRHQIFDEIGDDLDVPTTDPIER